MALIDPIPQGGPERNAFANMDHSTTMETFAASAELAGMDAFSQTLVKNFSNPLIARESEALGIKPLSVAELKQQYPDIEAHFTEPQYPSIAKNMAETLRKRRDLEKIIQGGPDTWETSVGKFGYSVWGSITDPGELALLGATTVLSGGLAVIPAGLTRAGMGLAARGGINTGLALGAAADAVTPFVSTGFNVGGRIASRFAPTVLGELGAVATTGVVEQLPMTIASQLSMGIAANAEGRPYTAKDFLEGVALNTALIAGIEGFRFGVGKLRGAISDRALVQMEEAVIEQANKGVRPNLTPMILDYINESTNTGGGRYIHGPLNESTQFYSASRTAVSDFKVGEHAAIGGNIGDGIYLTDNQFAAHGTAASKSNEVAGSVFHFDRTSLPAADKIVDYTQPFPPSMRAEIEAIVKREGMVRSVNLDEDSAISVIEKLREVSDMAVNEIQAAAKKAGYEAAYHKAEKIAGHDAVSPQNVINIFNKDALVPKAMSQGDRSLVPKYDMNAVKAEFDRAQDPLQQIEYQPTGRETSDEIKIQEQRLQDRVQQADKAILERKAEMKDAVDMGLIPESEAKAVDEQFAKAHAELRTEERFGETYINCRMGA